MEFVCTRGRLARQMKGGEPLTDKQLTGSREIAGSEQLIAKRSPEQDKRLVLTPPVSRRSLTILHFTDLNLERFVPTGCLSLLTNQQRLLFKPTFNSCNF